MINNWRAKLSRLQWVVLLTVLALSIFLSFQLINVGSGETTVDNLTATERLVAAQKGDLVN